MTKESISIKDTGYFSSFICNYLDESEELKPFYNRFPALESFEAQIEEKKLSVRTESRTTLVHSLSKQYEAVETSELTHLNIESLKESETFTITTGHQLNLFTGPLYFLYKIVSTINLTNTLKAEYPDYNFVPVYWMATEDHDFDEINYFNFRGKKIQWNREASGAVGGLNLKGLDAVFKVLSKEFGNSENAKKLKTLFEEAYLNHVNLADATFYLANELFKDYGLVIIDANHSELKRLFIPYVEEELVNHISYKTVTETSKKLGKVQVNPREINLFYLSDGLRERIINENGLYKVNNKDITWDKASIVKHLQNHPEKFSPNVIMRPLYQEVILPNLCYIGGGGELAYWLQLKDYFDAVNVTFPILLLRNSVLIQTEQQAKKLNKLNVSTHDIFLRRDAFINKKVREISNIDIDFTDQKEHLKDQFKALYDLAEQTDKSFIGAVTAQEKKQLKGLSHLEKRLLKAQKKKLADEVQRMTDIQNQLFPNQSLQERNTNFSEFYLNYGSAFIEEVVKNIDPLDLRFTILSL